MNTDSRKEHSMSIFQNEANRNPWQSQFGLCPECGGHHDDVLDVGIEEWAICRTCFTKWTTKYYTFVTWNTDRFDRNDTELEKYRFVEGVFPDDDSIQAWNTYHEIMGTFDGQASA